MAGTAEEEQALLAAKELEKKQLEEQGAQILNEVVLILKRWIWFPAEEYYWLLAVWAAHTYIYSRFDMTPRIAFMSLGPGSGKTRSMRVLKQLVLNAIMAANSTAPAIFLAIQARDGALTILLDETDTYMGNNNSHKEMRGILNAGAYSDGNVLRGRGVQNGEDPEIHVFAPVAFAGLGRLPATLHDRSFIYPMSKPKIRLEEYRPRLHNSLVKELGVSLGQWARAIGSAAADTFPDVIEGISGRDWEKAEPMIAIAMQAGEEWGERIIQAVQLVLGVGGEADMPPGLQALSDMRDVFTTRGMPSFIGSTEMAEALIEMQPWASEWGTATAGQRQLAALVSSYGVHPAMVRVSRSNTKRGYRLLDLQRAWDLHLPKEEAEEAPAA